MVEDAMFVFTSQRIWTSGMFKFLQFKRHGTTELCSGVSRIHAKMGKKCFGGKFLAEGTIARGESPRSCQRKSSARGLAQIRTDSHPGRCK